MLTVLSLMDERAKPKGSRDPLGVEAIWSHMGRQVVGNLTTITSKLDNFMVALLCCHHANTDSPPLRDIQTRYLCAEQLCAYLRLEAGHGDILGINRAKANLRSGKMQLGRSDAAQLLASQLSMGMWGLYSSAMQGAGLIKGEERRLTQRGHECVRQMIECMGAGSWQAFTLLAQPGGIKAEQLQTIVPGFRSMLRSSRVRRNMVDELLNWQGAKALQKELYKQATLYIRRGMGLQIGQFGPWLIEQSDSSRSLKVAMGRILALEPLLVLVQTLMNWLQAHHKSSRSDLCTALKPHLGALQLKDDWQEDSKLPDAQFLRQAFNAVHARQADAVIDTILQQNASIMRKRGGSAWLEWDRTSLRVRVPDNSGSLPACLATHCHNTWHNSYFINAFLHVISQGK